MSTRTYATGRIDRIKRLTNSVNGNPRYAITLEVRGLGAWSQTWNTAADHAFCYDIGNVGFRAGDTVTLTIGGRGTIVGIEPWCNHDAVAVIDGVCECGVVVAP